MTDNENLKIYNQVKKTDPQYTKAYSLGGGDSGTSVSGQYYILKATEVFGPQGLGWGFDVVVDRMDDGAPFVAPDSDNTIIFSKNHTLQIKLWYMLEDKRGEVTQYGHTKYLYKTSGGKVMVDSEYAKKSLTDAMKKALTGLGVCSDIFMGLHDDPEYVRATKADFAIENAIDSDKERANQIAVFNTEMDNNKNCMENATNLNELEGIFRVSFKTAKARGSELWMDKLKTSYDLKKSTFINVEK